MEEAERERDAKKAESDGYKADLASMQIVADKAQAEVLKVEHARKADKKKLELQKQTIDKVSTDLARQFDVGSNVDVLELAHKAATEIARQKAEKADTAAKHEKDMKQKLQQADDARKAQVSELEKDLSEVNIELKIVQDASSKLSKQLQQANTNLEQKQGQATRLQKSVTALEKRESELEEAYENKEIELAEKIAEANKAREDASEAASSDASSKVEVARLQKIAASAAADVFRLTRAASLAQENKNAAIAAANEARESASQLQSDLEEAERERDAKKDESDGYKHRLDAMQIVADEANAKVLKVQAESAEDKRKLNSDLDQAIKDAASAKREADIKLQNEKKARGRSEAALKKQLNELEKQATIAKEGNITIQNEKAALEQRVIQAEESVLEAIRKELTHRQAITKAERDLRDANLSIADAQTVIDNLQVESESALAAAQANLKAELDDSIAKMKATLDKEKAAKAEAEKALDISRGKVIASSAELALVQTLLQTVTDERDTAQEIAGASEKILKAREAALNRVKDAMIPQKKKWKLMYQQIGSSINLDLTDKRGISYTNNAVVLRLNSKALAAAGANPIRLWDLGNDDPSLWFDKGYFMTYGDNKLVHKFEAQTGKTEDVLDKSPFPKQSLIDYPLFSAQMQKETFGDPAKDFGGVNGANSVARLRRGPKMPGFDPKGEFWMALVVGRTPILNMTSTARVVNTKAGQDYKLSWHEQLVTTGNVEAAKLRVYVDEAILSEHVPVVNPPNRTWDPKSVVFTAGSSQVTIKFEAVCAATSDCQSASIHLDDVSVLQQAAGIWGDSDIIYVNYGGNMRNHAYITNEKGELYPLENHQLTPEYLGCFKDCNFDYYYNNVGVRFLQQTDRALPVGVGGKRYGSVEECFAAAKARPDIVFVGLQALGDGSMECWMGGSDARYDRYGSVTCVNPTSRNGGMIGEYKAGGDWINAVYRVKMNGTSGGVSKAKGTVWTSDLAIHLPFQSFIDPTFVKEFYMYHHAESSVDALFPFQMVDIGERSAAKLLTDQVKWENERTLEKEKVTASKQKEAEHLQRERNALPYLADKKKWKLIYHMLNGKKKLDLTSKNQYNTIAVVLRIDGKALLKETAMPSKTFNLWGTKTPSLMFDSRGYFMINVDGARVVEAFESGTGNGLGGDDFEQKFIWGESDIIYVHFGGTKKNVAYITNETGTMYPISEESGGKYLYTGGEARGWGSLENIQIDSSLVKEFYMYRHLDDDQDAVFNFEMVDLGQQSSEKLLKNQSKWHTEWADAQKLAEKEKADLQAKKEREKRDREKKALAFLAEKKKWQLVKQVIDGRVTFDDKHSQHGWSGYKSNAVVLRIDSRALLNATSMPRKKTRIWEKGNDLVRLDFDSRGFFIPYVNSREIFGAFYSGTGNGLGDKNFKQQFIWGDSDIIYVHYGGEMHNHVYIADEAGSYRGRMLKGQGVPWGVSDELYLSEMVKEFYMYRHLDDDVNATFPFEMVDLGSAAAAKLIENQPKWRQQWVIAVQLAAKAEAKRVANEKAEADRIAKKKAEKAEADRIAKEKADKAEADRIAKEKAKKAEADRIAKEKAAKKEDDRIAKEIAEKKKIKDDKNKRERLAREAAAKPYLAEKKKWKLTYQMLDGAETLNITDNRQYKNNAIVVRIDSRALWDASNSTGEETVVFRVGGNEPGLVFESRGYLNSYLQRRIAQFVSGTGNGQSAGDFRNTFKWGDSDIIYVHYGGEDKNQIYITDERGSRHTQVPFESGGAPWSAVAGDLYVNRELVKEFHMYYHLDENADAHFPFEMVDIGKVSASNLRDNQKGWHKDWLVAEHRKKMAAQKLAQETAANLKKKLAASLYKKKQWKLIYQMIEGETTLDLTENKLYESSTVVLRIDSKALLDATSRGWGGRLWSMGGRNPSLTFHPDGKLLTHVREKLVHEIASGTSNGKTGNEKRIVNIWDDRDIIYVHYGSRKRNCVYITNDIGTLYPLGGPDDVLISEGALWSSEHRQINLSFVKEFNMYYHIQTDHEATFPFEFVDVGAAAARKLINDQDMWEKDRMEKQKNIEFLGCFYDADEQEVWKWGGGNTALKPDGKFEFRPANGPSMDEYDMVNKCIEFVDPSMNTNAPFVVGLQNRNQCFYRKYDSSEFTNSRFMNTPKYQCKRYEGGEAWKTQVYKVLNPDEKVAKIESDRIDAEKAAEAEAARIEAERLAKIAAAKAEAARIEAERVAKEKAAKKAAEEAAERKRKELVEKNKALEFHLKKVCPNPSYNLIYPPLTTYWLDGREHRTGAHQTPNMPSVIRTLKSPTRDDDDVLWRATEYGEAGTRGHAVVIVTRVPLESEGEKTIFHLNVMDDSGKRVSGGTKGGRPRLFISSTHLRFMTNNGRDPKKNASVEHGECAGCLIGVILVQDKDPIQATGRKAFVGVLIKGVNSWKQKILNNDLSGWDDLNGGILYALAPCSQWYRAGPHQQTYGKSHLFPVTEAHLDALRALLDLPLDQFLVKYG